MSGKKCLLCRRNNDETVSYFNFPKSEEKRNIWLQKCGLTSSQVLKSSNLCSNHFANDCFVKPAKGAAKRRKLKNNAVPSLNLEVVPIFNEGGIRRLPQSCAICGRSKVGEKRTYHRFPDNIVLQREWLKCVEETKRPTPKTPLNARLCNIHFSADYIYEDPVTKKRRLKLGAIPISCLPNTALSTEELIIEETQSVSQLVDIQFVNIGDVQIDPLWFQESSDIETCIQNTCDKACQTETEEKNAILADHIYCEREHKLPQPRYVSEISTPHLSTPRRAKRCLNMSKRVIDVQKQKIAVLSQKLRRATSEIKTLNELIEYLCNRDFIYEDALNHLMVSNLKN